jgi:uncharacterized protein YutE (UPF0331/DUF86 family)
MDPQRKARYQDKLQKFDRYFDQYTKWLASHPINNLDLEGDAHWVYAIIHVFQNLAELCSDLAAMIIKDKKLIPKDNYSNYKLLQEKNILSEKSYQILIKVNGLRNRVAHEYNGLNYNIAWEAMEQFIDGLEAIKEEFGSWLAQR